VKNVTYFCDNCNKKLEEDSVIELHGYEIAPKFGFSKGLDNILYDLCSWCKSTIESKASSIVSKYEDRYKLKSKSIEDKMKEFIKEWE
jgi:hypothetical protein